ncbi:MAG: hypothetical protein QXY40_00935 [Candidatus Methanomethylicia archaeon]
MELRIKDIDINLFIIPDEWRELREPLGALIKAEEELKSGVIDVMKYEVLQRKYIEDIKEIIDRKTRTYNRFVLSYLTKING